MLDFSKDYDDSVLPEGWHDVFIDGAEYKESKTSHVDYLSLKFKTRDARVVFNIYNIFNKNDIARNIAMGEIKTILTLLGHDVSVLKQCTKEKLLELLTTKKYIQIAVVVFEDQFGKKNKIKKYKVSEAQEIKQVQDESLPF